MLTAGPGDPLYRFGPFIADPVVGRLYHGYDEVPLTPKSFSVLMVLVGLPGQLVGKEALFDQVWPETFVEPNNLCRTISMIRKVLHERDSDQEYIVTVTGRGYQFVAPVSQISRGEFADRMSSAPLNPVPPDTSAVGGVAVESTPDIASLRSVPERYAHAASEQSPSSGVLSGTWRSLRLALSMVVAFAAVIGIAGGLFLGSRGHQDAPGSEGRLWQLTTTGRIAGMPTWSPDGALIAYSSDRDGGSDIWAQRLSGGSPIQITSGPDHNWRPSWSPDGRYIAFRSERHGGGLFVVPALGGSATRISDFGYQPRWSPDGLRVLFQLGRELYLVGLDGAPPSRVAADVIVKLTGRFLNVAWHPDGRRISLYGLDRGDGWSLWTVPLDGGPSIRSRIAASVARRLRDTGVRLGAFVWAPGGDAIYFEGRSGQTQNLWRIRVNPHTLEWIAGPDRLTTSSSLESGLALSPDGQRLAFGSRVERQVARSFRIDPLSGRITGEGQAVTPEGANAKVLDISPDGSQLLYRVDGRNNHELWIRSLDGQADRLRKIEREAAIIQPRWSGDGLQLAYLRRPTDRLHTAALVLLAANDDREQQVLAAAQSPETVYDWGVDRDSLLVRCTANSGHSAICRRSNLASGSTAEMRLIAADAHRDLYAARYSPDGRWVSFIASPGSSRANVFVCPASGGPWIPITHPEDRSFEDRPRWSPDGRTLYFLSFRSRFWNVWGRRFDPDAGTPLDEPFQVSHFGSSVQMIGPDVSNLQIAVTRERLIIPITETSGAIWVLENVYRAPVH